MTVTSAVRPQRGHARAGLLAVVYGAAAFASLPVHGRTWHVAAHVIGGVALLATVTVMAAWMVVATASGRESALRRGAVAVARADLWVTGPAVVLVLANGLGLTVRWWGGWSALAATSWLSVGLGLMAVTGAIWLGVLVPTQLRMVRTARSPGPLDTAFLADLRRWMVYGTVATVLPWTALVVMRLKPTFW